VKARVVVLGAPHTGDDAAALVAADGLPPDLEVVRAGRPGAGLLDLLDDDAPTVLVDVVRGEPPGRVVRCPLADLPDVVRTMAPVSSHGFGAGDALRLGRVLGLALPPGAFVGILGTRFEVGAELSPSVAAAIDAFRAAIVTAAEAMGAAPRGASRPPARARRRRSRRSPRRR
jgi:hydrogenase maturation protease